MPPHAAAADAASPGVADGVPVCGGPDGALVAQAIPLDPHLQAGIGSQVQRRAQILCADLQAHQGVCPAPVVKWTRSKCAGACREVQAQVDQPAAESEAEARSHGAAGGLGNGQLLQPKGAVS